LGRVIDTTDWQKLKEQQALKGINLLLTDFVARMDSPA
jgi:hypothetical protein